MRTTSSELIGQLNQNTQQTTEMIQNHATPQFAGPPVQQPCAHVDEAVYDANVFINGSKSHGCSRFRNDEQNENYAGHSVESDEKDADGRN